MSADFTTITDENGTHTLRHTWTVDDARTGIVDAFLAATEQGLSERLFGRTPTMRIQGSEGDTEAVLIHPDHLERLQDAADELHHLKDTGRDQSKAWEPFMVGPFAEPDGNRLIPHDQGDPRRPHRVLRVRLDADAEGIVPVLAWSDLGRIARWQLAWATPAPGLFVRSRGAADYAIVTGSGTMLHAGYSSREQAATAAARVHEAAPGIDWFVTVDSNAWDADTVDAIKAALAPPRPAAGDQ